MGCKPSKSCGRKRSKATARFELVAPTLGSGRCKTDEPVDEKTKEVEKPDNATEYRRRMKKKREKSRFVIQPEDCTLFEVSTRIKEQNFDT